MESGVLDVGRTDVRQRRYGGIINSSDAVVHK